MMIFGRDTKQGSYRNLSALKKLEILEDDLKKLQKKFKKDADKLAAIDIVMDTIAYDKKVLAKDNSKSIEILDYIAKQRNNFAGLELKHMFKQLL